MGDEDAGQGEGLDGPVDGLLAVHVEVAGGLVEDQDARLLVQRPGQEQALLLAARQHGAHVADQGVVAHRHGGDLVVDLGQAGALLDAGAVGRRVEEADVVGDGAGKQGVVLHHRADQRPGRLAAAAAQAGLADQHVALHRREDAEDEVDESRLAAARGADEGYRLARRDLQVDAVHHPRVGLGVAEAQALQADRRHRGGSLGARRGVGFGAGEHDVGEALALQAQHAQLEELLDQPGNAAVELVLVGLEGHQHAHRHQPVEGLAGAEPQDGDADQPEQQAVDRFEGDEQALGAHPGVHLLGHQAQPARAALVLALKQLDGLDAADSLEKVGLLAGVVDDLLLGGEAQRAEPQGADQRVGEHRRHRHPGQRRAVEEHHGQGDARHQPVDEGREEGRGELALDLLHRPEARHDVAQVALLEVLHRQTQQMGKDIGAPLQAEIGADVQQDPRAQRRKHLLDDEQQAEAEGQRGEQVAVGRHQHVVDHPLQVEGAGQREDLEGDGQDQHLGAGAEQAVHPADQVAEADRRRRRGGAEVGGRPQLQGHAGKAAGDLVLGHPAPAAGGIVDEDAAAGDLLEHHEVVEVPVQDARRAQLAEVFEVEAQGPAGQAQGVGDADQLPQGGAVLGDRKLPAQLGQVGAPAVVARHHAEAGQAALGGLGLQDDGERAPEGGGQVGNQGHGLTVSR